MATNRSRANGRKLYLPVPSGTKSGDPVMVGFNLAGVALTDRDADGKATIDTRGVYRLPVTAGASAIEVGYAVYAAYGAAPNYIVSVANEGTDQFGIALEAVPANTTKTIEVKIGY